MLRSDKERIVEELAERLRQTSTLIVADYRGLTMKEVDELRTQLLEHGARFTVVKNSLTRRAAEEAGAAHVLALLEGPTAIAFLETDGDPVAVAKALADTARATKVLAVRGGVLDGTAMSAEQVEELAKLPPADVLRSQVLGAVTAPLYAIVGLFTAPLQELHGLLQARIDQLGGEEEASEPASEAESVSDQEASEAATEPAEDDKNATSEAATEPAYEETKEEPVGEAEPVSDQEGSEAATELAEDEREASEAATEPADEETTDEPVGEAEPVTDEREPEAATEPAEEQPAAGTESAEEDKEA
jgi:large subunit ribosomal protein L10